jgi:hypothetical protein
MSAGLKAAEESPSLTTEIPKAKVEGPTFKGNALLQFWTFNANDPRSATGPTGQLNFRLRRAELRGSGNIVESARYFVMVDPAKAFGANGTPGNVGSLQILQDIGVGFTVLPGLEVVGGQFKQLTNAEGLASSADLLFPERSRVARYYGDYREPGMMVSYKTGIFQIGSMVSNATATNQFAKTNAKALSTRLDVAPVTGVKAGAFLRLGDFSYDNGGEWGANVRVNPNDRSTVGVEYNMGKNAGVSSLGFVADAAYLVTNEIQPVARYEIFKPNKDKSFVASQPTLGVNYLVSKNAAKLQAAISYLDGMTSNNGSPTEVQGVYGSLFTLSFQASL